MACNLTIISTTASISFEFFIATTSHSSTDSFTDSTCQFATNVNCTSSCCDFTDCFARNSAGGLRIRWWFWIWWTTRIWRSASTSTSSTFYSTEKLLEIKMNDHFDNLDVLWMTLHFNLTDKMTDYLRIEFASSFSSAIPSGKLRATVVATKRLKSFIVNQTCSFSLEKALRNDRIYK